MGHLAYVTHDIILPPNAAPLSLPWRSAPPAQHGAGHEQQGETLREKGDHIQRQEPAWEGCRKQGHQARGSDSCWEEQAVPPNRRSNKVLELQQGRLTLCSRKLAAEDVFKDKNRLLGAVGESPALRSAEEQHHHGCLHQPGEGEMSKIKTRVE